MTIMLPYRNALQRILYLMHREGPRICYNMVLNYGLNRVMDRWQLYPHFSYPIIHKFSHCFEIVSNINDALDFVYSFEFLGVTISPMQLRDEIGRLLNIIEKFKPSVILEIGTSRGGTLSLFTIVAENEAVIISIDLPGGPFGGGYPKWKIPLYRSFARQKQKIHLIRNNSHVSFVLDKIRGILGNKKVDFLFLDGDHSYEGIKKDFEMYSPLVRCGGIVALHDIVDHPIWTGCAVSKFWREVKTTYEYMEIVHDWKQGWAGIGVLFL